MLDTKRLFSVFADASQMHAEAGMVLPLKGQITWGFFRMGAEAMTAPANNNKVSSKEFVAKAFQENCNEAVYGITRTSVFQRKQAKRNEFTEAAAKIISMPVSHDLFVDHGRVMSAHVVEMVPEPDVIPSDSFDSKIVDFKKYKQDHLKHSA